MSFGYIVSCAGAMLIASSSLGAGGDLIRRSAKTQAYWVEQVTGGLIFPSSMVWLSNGDMLVTERPGNLRMLHNGKLDPKPVNGVPPCFYNGFDGLKEVVLDPDHETNGILYLLISEGTYDQRHAAVYRARYDINGLEDVDRVFRSNDGIGGFGMIASRMLFLADGTLLVAVPEDRKQKAQQLTSHIGKIVRINRDGSVPQDNPFLTTPNALPEIWTYGHRVPLGLYQDAQSGAILEVESGPVGGDELNLLKAGGNFGWAQATWGFEYHNGGLSAPSQSGPGIEDPVLIWMPSVTPSGLTRYRGSAYSWWNGDYFAGHLTTKELERFRIEGDRVVLQERMLVDLEERIRDVKIGPDGYIYILTDNSNGRLLRLRPGFPREDETALIALKLEQQVKRGDRKQPVVKVRPGDPQKGKQAFLERCAACHSVGTTVEGGKIGPDLVDAYGRGIGRRADFNYSATMKDAPESWNLVTLDQFLADPGGLMPGTRMAAPPVNDPELRQQIIGFLKQQAER